MQASIGKATWFNMQKLVVNNYALDILVLRSQHLLKVLTSIASRSLTVTDPRPNKIHFDEPSKPNQPKPTQSQVPTNHVRVHATNDHEHGCYNSFTLCRCCTHYPSVVIIHRQPNTRCTDEHSYTLPWCVLGNHYKTVQ
jgi:hypothetical protein